MEESCIVDAEYLMAQWLRIPNDVGIDSDAKKVCGRNRLTQEVFRRR